MISEKLRLLSEVNEKLMKFQNMMQIRLDFTDDEISKDINFSDIGHWKEYNDDLNQLTSRIKTSLLYNRPDNENIIPIMYEGKKGGIVATHKHLEVEIPMCMEGSVKFTLNNEKEYILTESQSIYIESHQLHKMEFLSNAKLNILFLNV